MKKILPILAVAFLVGCGVPGDSSNTTSLITSDSEEPTSEVSSSIENSTSGEVSCLALECEESSSSQTTSSEEVSSSETTSSSEESSSSEPLPTFTITVTDNLVDLPDNIIVSHENPVEQGTPITITAGEIEGYTFIHWLVTDSQIIASTQATIEINIENNIKLTAIYEVIILENFAPDLFISEYIEGASNNKAFEIANFTGADVDLSLYTIALYGNGSATATRTQVLTGILPHGEVFVIAGDSIADSGMLDAVNRIPENRKLVSDFNQGSIAEAYNGDDAFAILKDNYLVDVFGTIGFDPGTGWDQYTYGEVEAGVTPTTIDRTLIRIAGYGPMVSFINQFPAFNPIEWRVHPTHYQTLGFHAYTITA